MPKAYQNNFEPHLIFPTRDANNYSDHYNNDDNVLIE